MSAWRQAGLNYINYSNIAAKMLRRSLKPQLRTEALKRDESHVRITPWANGRPALLMDADKQAAHKMISGYRHLWTQSYPDLTKPLPPINPFFHQRVLGTLQHRNALQTQGRTIIKPKC